MKSRRSLILLCIPVILIALFFSAAWFFAAFVMTGHRQTLEEAMEWQSAHYDTSFYQTLEKEDYTVPGYDGYVLHAELLKNPKETEKYVILSHGNTDNRMGSLKYVPMYLDLGFNCIIYDLRGHGENEMTFTAYGLLEGQDLAKLVEDTRARYPKMEQLGLHGESLGAALTIAALEYQPDVDFVVSDCAFSDIENVLREGYRNAHVPAFLFDLADIGARIRYHYSLKDMRPIDTLNENMIPVLFIHGADDNLILPQNARDLYDRTKGMKELHFIDGAGHAESILHAPEEYKGYVTDFLHKTS